MTTRMSVLLVGLLVWGGCAASLHQRGKERLAQGDYPQAVQLLQAARQKEQGNADLLVDLAQALYHQNELTQAEEHLRQAGALSPDNERIALVQGLILEQRGQRQAAIAAYRSYTQMSRLSAGRKLAKARMDRLLRQQIREETKAALEREGQLEVETMPGNSVAVSPFRNATANSALDPLKKGLAEMMVTDLSKVQALQVVERLRMQEMMQEIGLGATGLVDAASVPRLGKLLGASKVVNGSFTDLAADQLRLDIHVARVETGAVEASQVSGPLAKLFRLQKELTFDIVAQLGIRLTDAERDAIQTIPTENLLAFMAYSTGVDLEDQGRTTAAAAAFAAAVQLDPQFGMAREGMERTEGAALDIASLDRTQARKAAATEPGGNGKLDRLATTGAYAGAGFIPTDAAGERDVREPIEEQEEVDFGGAGVKVEVIVPLPQRDGIDVRGAAR